MKKIISLLCLLCAVVIITSGCQTEPVASHDDMIIEDMTNDLLNKQEATLQGSTGVTIGVVMATFNNTGWKALFSGMIKNAIEQGINLLCYSSDNDAQTQIDQIDRLIELEVDGILFVPVDSEKLSVVADTARQKGIPIVAVDRSITNNKLDALVESDNVEIGRQAAEQMNLISKGKQLNIFVLQGDMATSAGVERDNGFMNQIKEYGNCQVVGNYPAQWKADAGYNAIIEAFKNNPEINAVYLPSDAYTQGVIVALELLGKLKPIGHPDHIIIVSVDGHPVGLENIRKEYIDVDIGQPLYLMGQTAMEMCFKLTNNESIDPSIIRMQPHIINADNVDASDLWANLIK